MNKYVYKSGIELVNLIRTGQATSVDVVDEHLEQIQRHNSSLNAVVIQRKTKQKMS